MIGNSMSLVELFGCDELKKRRGEGRGRLKDKRKAKGNQEVGVFLSN